MVELDSPDYSIIIGKLSAPCDVISILKTYNTKKYCYAFYLNSGIIMNIGMSIGSIEGDRIYRKIGNLPGWESQALQGERGEDIKEVVLAVEDRYKVKVHKDDIIVDIWNTTNLITETLNDPTIDAEKKLVRDCEIKYGHIPVGNFQDPRKRNRSISITIFNNLFEEEK